MTPHPAPTTTPSAIPSDHRPYVIAAWMVPFLALPMRTWFDDPARSVLPLIQPGMRILEIGPGSGFFTVPMAQAIGPSGALVCVELQAVVLRRLQAKLQRRALSWVQVRPCTNRDLQIDDLAQGMDLVVAIDVIHEMPDPARALAAMASSLRPGGRLLIMEPKGHCKATFFQVEKSAAIACGLRPLPTPMTIPSKRHAALFERP